MVCSIPPLGQSGTCIPGCVDDGGCRLGERCVSQGRRSECVPGCNDDADCRLDQICDVASGTCLSGRCQTADVCGPCQRCSETGHCVDARRPGAPETQFCGTCGTCSPRSFCAACGPDGYCDELGRCAPACPPDGCPRGFTCRQAEGDDPRLVCFPLDEICDTECT
jgi:hypothetical protein